MPLFHFQKIFENQINEIRRILTLISGCDFWNFSNSLDFFSSINVSSNENYIDNFFKFKQFKWKIYRNIWKSYLRTFGHRRILFLACFFSSFDIFNRLRMYYHEKNCGGNRVQIPHFRRGGYVIKVLENIYKIFEKNIRSLPRSLTTTYFIFLYPYFFWFFFSRMWRENENGRKISLS